MRPSTTSEKYSESGPKASAAVASGGAKQRPRPIVAIVPAMNEPMAAMPSAVPAWPLMAIW